MESFFVPYQAVSRLPAQRVVLLAPHPDDEVLGCAGALAGFVAHQVPVQVLILTDESDASRARQRREESRAAARCLDYGEPLFWGLPDGALLQEADLSTRISQWLERQQPDLVLTPSPWEMHPDHRALAQATIAALLLCSFPVQVAFYEIGIPLLPNVLLDITAYQPLKHQAMACFPSQLARQPYDQHMLALNRYRTYTLPVSVHWAEAYLLLGTGALQALGLAHTPEKITRVLHQAQESLGAMTQRVQQAEAEVLGLQAQLAQAQVQAQSWQQQLEALQGSRSWRLTAGLRTLAGCLRRIAG